MFTAFDQLSNSTSSDSISLFQSQSTSLLAGLMEMKQQDVDEKKENSYCEGESGCVDVQSCGSGGMKELEQLHQTKSKVSEKKIKKHRYAFQTRSHVDILDDGYRWRKYGQKAVKNYKFPRSYYRCTHQGCNVKKQVQRVSRDEGVVITTYEGVHSHPIQKSTDTFEHILTQMHMYNT